MKEFKFIFNLVGFNLVGFSEVVHVWYTFGIFLLLSNYYLGNKFDDYEKIINYVNLKYWIFRSIPMFIVLGVNIIASLIYQSDLYGLINLLFYIIVILFEGFLEYMLKKMSIKRLKESKEECNTKLNSLVYFSFSFVFDVICAISIAVMFFPKEFLYLLHDLGLLII